MLGRLIQKDKKRKNMSQDAYRLISPGGSEIDLRL